MTFINSYWMIFNNSSIYTEYLSIHPFILDIHKSIHAGYLSIHRFTLDIHKLIQSHWIFINSYINNGYFFHSGRSSIHPQILDIQLFTFHTFYSSLLFINLSFPLKRWTYFFLFSIFLYIYIHMPHHHSFFLSILCSTHVSWSAVNRYIDNPFNV